MAWEAFEMGAIADVLPGIRLDAAHQQHYTDDVFDISLPSLEFRGQHAVQHPAQPGYQIDPVTFRAQQQQYMAAQYNAGQFSYEMPPQQYFPVASLSGSHAFSDVGASMAKSISGPIVLSGCRRLDCY